MDRGASFAKASIKKSRFPQQIKRSSDLLNKVFFESLE